MINILNYYDKILDKNHISPSSYFEWNTYRVFNNLGEYSDIIPNFKLNKDGQPSGCAKPGVADIKIEYQKITLLLECSLRSGQAQVDTEGNSVYRHSIDVNAISNKICLTLFISPSIHNELYEYYLDHSKVNIIPLTLWQFKKLAVYMKTNGVQLTLLHLITTLSCNNFESYRDWKLSIESHINSLETINDLIHV